MTLMTLGCGLNRRRRAAAAAGGGGGDPYFSSVVLLAVNDNAADGTTTFDDQSTSNKTLTRAGSAQYDTAQAPTGMTSSGLFAAATGDGIDGPASADFNYGTGDFTIEYMIRFDASGRQYTYDIGTNVSALIVTPSSGRVEGYGPASYVIDAGATAFNTAQWYHIALVRSGNDWTVYRDGISYVTATDTRSWGSTTGTPFFPPGGGAYGGVRFNGWMSNIRITKGVARYTANFTPPTLPLPTS